MMDVTRSVAIGSARSARGPRRTGKLLRVALLAVGLTLGATAAQAADGCFLDGVGDTSVFKKFKMPRPGDCTPLTGFTQNGLSLWNCDGSGDKNSGDKITLSRCRFTTDKPKAAALFITGNKNVQVPNSDVVVKATPPVSERTCSVSPNIVSGTQPRASMNRQP